MLAGHDVEARLLALLEQRADAYAECHAEIDTQGRNAIELAQEVLAVVADAPIAVPLGARSYRVEVGRGVRARLSQRVAAVARSPRIVLVSDDRVAPLWGQPLEAALREGGREVVSVTLPAGEQHKNLGSVERIWEAALEGGIDRGGAFVGVGGGVIGDLSAFAASTFLRGVAAGHVPTTLLAMVDSAIGGKTGFDTRSGKNLIGTFHQPSFVLCDVDVLATLPAAERTAGLAEVIKSAWIDGEAAVAMLEQDREALRAGDPDATARAIRMSAALKARIVTEDEREAGARALLNLGHTLGARDRGLARLQRHAPRRGGCARHGRGVQRQLTARSRGRRRGGTGNALAGRLGAAHRCGPLLERAGAFLHRLRQEAPRRLDHVRVACRAWPRRASAAAGGRSGRICSPVSRLARAGRGHPARTGARDRSPQNCGIARAHATISKYGTSIPFGRWPCAVR